jgi:hypothetical protein
VVLECSWSSAVCSGVGEDSPARRNAGRLGCLGCSWAVSGLARWSDQDR